MQAMRVRSAAIVIGVTLLAGCATVTTPTKGDPFESYNRTMFTINDKVDQLALKPVAKAYVWAVPEPVRNSVTNFFSNIGDIYIAANNLAQLKIADGVSDIMRVAMNTVFGVGGLFDVATLAKLPKHEARLRPDARALWRAGGPVCRAAVARAEHGAGHGAARSSIISAIRSTYVKPDSLSWALYGVDLIDMRANLLGASDVLSDAALDKYSFVRNAYLQRRQYLITGGEGSAPDYGEAPLPNYDENAAAAPAAASAAAVPLAPASATAAPATAAEGASGTAEAPAAASGTGSSTIPSNQMVPPRIPSFPSIRLR